MRLAYLLSPLFLVAACGEVVSSQIDAAPSCGPGLEACGPDCVDLATNDDHCGECDMGCGLGMACAARACVGPVSCAAIRAADPSAQDGEYTIDPGTGRRSVFCDMTHGGVTYERLGFGRDRQAPDGYSQVSVADLTDPVIRRAFIYLFNAQGGAAANLDVGFMTSNCCFRAADSGPDQVLHFGGLYLYPAAVGEDDVRCSPDGGYVDASYRFFFAEDGPYSPGELPDDFFTTRPATNATACDASGNPAFFFRRY
jgi:hypothetical protein